MYVCMYVCMSAKIPGASNLSPLLYVRLGAGLIKVLGRCVVIVLRSGHPWAPTCLKRIPTGGQTGQITARVA